MIVLQDDSLPTVWEEVYGLNKILRGNHLGRNWGNRKQHFWWVNGNFSITLGKFVCRSPRKRASSISTATKSVIEPSDCPALRMDDERAVWP
jgi:hypothetical protein